MAGEHTSLLVSPNIMPTFTGAGSTLLPLDRRGAVGGDVLVTIFSAAANMRWPFLCLGPIGLCMVDSPWPPRLMHPPGTRMAAA